MDTNFKIGKPLLNPVMKGLLFFIAGIISERFISPDSLIILPATVISLFALTVFINLNRTGIFLAALSLFLAGMSASSVENAGVRQPDIPDNFINSAVRISGIVYGDSKFSNGNSRFAIKNPSVYMDSSRIQLNGSLVCVLYGKKILPSERDSVNMDGRIIRSENPPSYNIRIPFLSKEQKDYSFKFINGVNMPNPSIVGGRGGLWDGMRGAFSGFIDKYDYWGTKRTAESFSFR